MQALVLDGEVRVKDIPVPRPPPGEALIRVLTAGICNTDIELSKGYMKLRGVPGHEFVGIVEECDTQSLVGARVVGEINCVCRVCRYCQLEMPHHCLSRTVLGILGRNGAFAEYLTLPEENLHVVPDDLPDSTAVFTEPTAAAFRILEQVEITQDDRVIVLGDGKLGLLIAQVLSRRTKRLVCVGKHPWKLEVLEELGIKTVRADMPMERGADFVIEATGSHGGLPRALELVRPEGTVVLKTTVAQPTAIELSTPVINEVRVIGSRCGPFRPALDALTAGAVEVQPLVSETVDLKDAARALQRAQHKDCLKVLIKM